MNYLLRQQRQLRAPPVRPPSSGSPTTVPVHREKHPYVTTGVAERDPRRSEMLTLAERRAFGPLLDVLDEPDLRDILVQCGSAGGSVWVDRGHGVSHLAGLQPSATEVRSLATGLIAAGGRHLDDLEPCADVRLGKGIRVHAVLAPIVAEGAAISIRVQQTARPTLVEMVSSGLCDHVTASTLLNAVRRRHNLLVTGATASGKTTLLAALLDEVPATERIVSIEDVAELQLRHPHHVALEARQANSEGIGAVTLDRLLRESLRMRPDRIVLGECRGPEVATLLAALNTGHDGGAGTLHANSIHDVPARLEALGALAGMSAEALARQAVSALQLVVHVARQGTQHSIEALASLHLGSDGLLVVHEKRNSK